MDDKMNDVIDEVQKRLGEGRCNAWQSVLL